MAGRKAGWRGALWGGICGTIPDLDVLANLIMNELQSNMFHRTITHSILFFVIMTPLLGYLIHRLYPDQNATRRDWSLLAFLALFTHALLDCFTTWGTALFWPSGQKIAFKSIFVIDPLYTIPLILLTTAALFLNRADKKRRMLNYTGLVLSSLYLMLTLVNKQYVNKVFESALADQEISWTRYDTRPAPVNNILWSVNAETRDGYYTGYYSLLDPDQDVQFLFHPKNQDLLREFSGAGELDDLAALSEDWFTVEKISENALLFNDLRFGTNRAWENGGEFIFSYIIRKQPDGTLTIVQADRSFEDPPSVILSKLWNRILGK